MTFDTWNPTTDTWHATCDTRDTGWEVEGFWGKGWLRVFRLPALPWASSWQFGSEVYLPELHSQEGEGANIIELAVNTRECLACLGDYSIAGEHIVNVHQEYSECAHCCCKMASEDYLLMQTWKTTKTACPALEIPHAPFNPPSIQFLLAKSNWHWFSFKYVLPLVFSPETRGFSTLSVLEKKTIYDRFLVFKKEKKKAFLVTF